MNNNYSVVIIGAGMAGLGAALTLQTSKSQFSTDFILLEAQNRPGGRIETLQIGSSTIDLGAQWVHGTDTDLYDILQENKLIHPVTSDEGLGIYIRDDGHIIDNFLVKKVDFEVGRILEECEEYLDIITNSSVGEFLTKRFGEFLKKSDYSDDDKIIMEELFDWHVRFQVIDNSCEDLNKLSLKEWGRYSCLGKDGQQHVNIKGGYGALVDVLVKKLPENAIQYNKVVQYVEISSSGAILITCDDGSTLHAQSVIVTCSLGVLKHFKGLPMSPKVKTTIANMGFDGMGKVFLEFDSKWWGSDFNGIQLIWRNGKNSSDEFPDLLRHLSGFDLVLDQNNMLMTWVGHKGVREMEETDAEIVGKQCVQLLRKFLADDSIPFPVKVYK